MEKLAVASSQASLDYERIERAILFLESHHTQQPSLQDVADHVHLSPFHFERMFSRWAGTTPQRFLRYLTKEYAKQLLNQSRDVLDVSYSVGLSSPGRLHDLFVTYEALSPGEYKQKAKGMDLYYGVHPTPFGPALVAVTRRGVCGLVFLQEEDPATALAGLQEEWPDAHWAENPLLTRATIDQIFAPARTTVPKPIHLLLKGTNFQVKVWEALLKIPAGQLAHYGHIAEAVGNPQAVRAVGTACGKNHIAYLIPCHRVLQKAGQLGGYRWGTARKKAMLAWEAAQYGQLG
ncbi:AraC family transcriptional regulator, regulatory protein of adaptative response / methylated-DNA-[protein]-cysteine methyltransferase [Catalinimonas alkaloidigena]|uniref:methylated-DNA--[protein]-cysteine S-methyltransferase n=1 Tax=Catalinimonas alkaloidigena TaxID=1075417 RepID=A0A1G9SJ07_9BACT|nr:methylated-DNA--[protein]-cysteine S-methyltransferase [Catalinimonas alkaloidigena]SDM35484.1 AraC family transcriptional regulator, regulatory protein of adaptative response / methylated-DNA-[protein]-cysteine methyltransferase [Catalinimonas alkaloidigena]